jgi:hypothetical protein
MCSHRQILNALTSKILPELRTQIKSDKQKKRFFVAFAAVKVVKKLPEALQFEHLPGIITCTLWYLPLLTLFSNMSGSSRSR